MAGKPGMHKKVLNPAAVERIRERIQADKIIKKLEGHILDSEEMTSSQVTAALGLLKKRVPDLSAVEVSGDPDNPLKAVVRVEIVPMSENADSAD